MSIAKDGKILLDCKKGCTFSEIAAAMGIPAKDFFPEQPQRAPWELLREHIYTNLDGGIIAKKQIFRKPDGSKTAIWYRMENGQYVKGLNGLKMPLYHLHKFTKATGTLVIVEGEKDAETMERLEYAATTSPNGAGSKWRKEYNKYLKDRNVVIITDNDEPGEAYGKDIAEKIQGDAADVKLIRSADIYPDVKHKGDISDIAAAVGDAETKQLLIDAIKRTANYKPDAAPNEGAAPEPVSAVDAAVDVEISETTDDTQSETEYTYQKLEKIGFSTKWRKQGGMLCYDGVKKCNRNIKLYIWFRNLLNDVRYNEFAGYAERLKGGKWEKISDYDLLQLITRIEKKAYTEGGDYADLKVISEWDIKKEFVADYILENAKRVNPVKEYFESLHWDGKERISTLLHTVLGADNNAYTTTATRLFLLGIISRIYEPGTKFDYMIILQGRQGYGKSAFLKALAVKPEWYGSIGAAHMGGTDAKKLLGEDAAGKIILEYEELDGIRQTTAEKLKATITRTDDQYRQAYSVLSEMHPRQYVFAGTTNNGQYLSDPTGNRRFLPIPITKKGFLTPETVNQVWAEAFTLYKQGNFKLYLDDDVETIAETYRDNATRLISDDFTETIESFLNCRTPNGTPIQTTTVKEIYQALYDDPLGKMKYNDAQKIIITALNMLQWTNKQVKINGKNCRRYVRPQGDT
jgi:predicted P-loop ATPase/5S rRNA maturation endonuclease (ribonuclease M5)